MIIAGMSSGGAAGTVATPVASTPPEQPSRVAPEVAAAARMNGAKGAAATNEAPASEDLAPTQTVLAPRTAERTDQLPTESAILPWPSTVDTRPPAPQAEFFEALIAARVSSDAEQAASEPVVADAPESAPIEPAAAVDAPEAPDAPDTERPEAAPPADAPPRQEKPPVEPKTTAASQGADAGAAERFREGLNAVRNAG